MIISRTPLRVSFVGGGTDFPAFHANEEGAVLSCTINKYIYICINQKFGGDIRVSYSKTENVYKVDEIQHDLVRESLKFLGIERGIEIVSIGDVPAGVGLGGSGAFLVGLLNALHAFQGERVAAEQLAREACEIEIEKCGRPVGKQDQYAAAFGGLRLYTFLGNEVLEMPIPVNLADFKRDLLLFWTAKTHSSTEILSKQVENIENQRGNLRSMTALANWAVLALRQGKIERLGEILDTAWGLKRQLAPAITTREIDGWYDTAKQCGAIGGKLLGAGKGGFLLISAPYATHGAILEGIGLSELPFFFTDRGSEIIYYG